MSPKLAAVRVTGGHLISVICVSACAADLEVTACLVASQRGRADVGEGAGTLAAGREQVVARGEDLRGDGVHVVAGQLAAPLADLAGDQDGVDVAGVREGGDRRDRVGARCGVDVGGPISVMSACLPGVREPTLWDRPALAAPPRVANRSRSEGAS